MRKATTLLSAFAFLLFLSLTALCMAQEQLVGEWKGALSAGGQTFHILWHVVKGTDGNAISTYDNVEQGVAGIKVQSITVKGSDVTVVVADVIHTNGEDIPVNGTFTGVISKDGNEISGTWKQTQPPQPPTDLVFQRKQPRAAAPMQQIAGDWRGTLRGGGAELRVVFHFVPGNDGLTGTLDSVDQGANGIPITSISLKDGKLHLAVDAVQGTYDGSVNGDGSAINGTWSQGQPLQLDLTRGALPPPAKAAAPTDIDGAWEGMLDAGSMKLRIIYKLENTEAGLTVKMQSPDQSPMWTAPYPVTRNGTSVAIVIKANGSAYDGRLSADLASIDGTFQQSGNSIPLTLKRAKD